MHALHAPVVFNEQLHMEQTCRVSDRRLHSTAPSLVTPSPDSSIFTAAEATPRPEKQYEVRRRVRASVPLACYLDQTEYHIFLREKTTDRDAAAAEAIRYCTSVRTYGGVGVYPSKLFIWTSNYYYSNFTNCGLPALRKIRHFFPQLVCNQIVVLLLIFCLKLSAPSRLKYKKSRV